MRYPPSPTHQPFVAGILPEAAWEALHKNRLSDDLAALVRQHFVVLFHVPREYRNADMDPNNTVIEFNTVPQPAEDPFGLWHIDRSVAKSATALFLTHHVSNNQGRSCATGYVPGVSAQEILASTLHDFQQNLPKGLSQSGTKRLEEALSLVDSSTQEHSEAARCAAEVMSFLSYHFRIRYAPLLEEVHQALVGASMCMEWTQPGALAVFADYLGIHSYLPSTRAVPPVQLVTTALWAADWA
jgi:hypothetical protein